MTSIGTTPQPRSHSSALLAVARVAAIGISLLIGVGCAEVLLRAAHYYPPQDRLEPGQPTFNESEPILGWRNKQGAYVLHGIPPGAPDIRLTNWSDGRRATAATEEHRERRLAIVGCSYTQGYALSDEQTYPWKLQARFPGIEVDNYGTAAYGTYQSLLTLERMFAEGRAPSIVLYGFADLHEWRNVAPAWWMRFLRSYATRGHIDVPFCTLDRAGTVVRHAPERYTEFPLRDRLRTVSLLEQAYMQFRTRGRGAQARPVTEQLLLQMQRLCAAHHVPFVVAMVNGDTSEVRAHYAEFCRAHGITFVDASVPRSPDFRVQGDGHPNAKATDMIAATVAPVLEPIVRQLLTK